MLEEFYPVRVLNRIQKSEDKFWEEKRLDFRDWQGDEDVFHLEII